MNILEIKDLVGVSKPLTKLVETFGAAAAVLYEPHRIRAKAKADADANLISAGSQAASEAVLARARMRITEEEFRRQENLESIMTKAANVLPDQVSDDVVDPDWAVHFINEAKDTSNEDIQELWARLLVGEVARPGRFSRRIISLIKTLEHKDAQIFSELCSLCISASNYKVPIADWDLLRNEEIIPIEFDDVLHLQSLGLISFNGSTSFAWSFEKSEIKAGRICLEYAEKLFTIEVDHFVPEPGGAVLFPMGNVVLTSSGQELAQLVDQEYRENVFRYLLHFFEDCKPASPFRIPSQDRK